VSLSHATPDKLYVYSVHNTGLITIDFRPSNSCILDHLSSADSLRYLQCEKDKTSVCCQEDDAKMLATCSKRP
jgi:hypothetical protein